MKLSTSSREVQFAAVATSVLDIMTLPARAAATIVRRLRSMLLYEAFDPNAARSSLLEKVDKEAVWSRRSDHQCMALEQWTVLVIEHAR